MWYKTLRFFDCNTEEAAAFKLSGEAYNEAFALRHSENFNPGDKGKPMKNWITVSFAQKEYWARFALAAFEEVFK